MLMLNCIYFLTYYIIIWFKKNLLYNVLIINKYFLLELLKNPVTLFSLWDICPIFIPLFFYFLNNSVMKKNFFWNRNIIYNKIKV